MTGDLPAIIFAPMHAMLQEEKPNDYVIATGESHRVCEFVVEVHRCLSLVPAGRNSEVVNEYVEVNPKLFRTGEIHDLHGDSSLARRSLNWSPEVDFKGLVRMMVESDTGRRELAEPFAQLTNSGVA